MQDFRKLNVWVEAHSLTLGVYAVTRSFPRDELFGLTSQLRRAASSIELNICEGCGSSSRKTFARYIDNAACSSSEVEGAILIARDLGFVTFEAYETLEVSVVKVKKMLRALHRKLSDEDSTD